jgi:hypothetical protein
VAIRAKADAQQQPTELVLSRSTFSGESIRVNTNRKYLARALKLGFREVLLHDPKTAVVCRDDSRVYIWMPLDDEAAIPPAENAIRILSDETADPVTNFISQPRNRIKRMLPQTNENGHAKANGQKIRAKADHQGITTLIEQAERLRTAQRDNLVKTNDLVKALKRHRRQSRIVQNTLASLRQLKTIGV